MVKIGSIIKELRIKNDLTQAKLAEELNVSNKTISKWENDKGFPDILLLEKICELFHLSLNELFMGEKIENKNINANIRKMKFYYCPICHNLISAIGECDINCCGLKLKPLEATLNDLKHQPKIEKIENQYYLSFDHEQTKKHYLSYLIGIYDDYVSVHKFYPEQTLELYLNIAKLKEVGIYCNLEGFYKYPIKKF